MRVHFGSFSVNKILLDKFLCEYSSLTIIGNTPSNNLLVHVTEPWGQWFKQVRLPLHHHLHIITGLEVSNVGSVWWLERCHWGHRRLPFFPFCHLSHLHSSSWGEDGCCTSGITSLFQTGRGARAEGMCPLSISFVKIILKVQWLLTNKLQINCK